MVQIYLVSVVCNMTVGMILAGTYLSKKAPSLETIAVLPATRPRFTWILGLVTGLAGLLKFGTVLSGDIPVAGDLLPALIGVWMGASLVYRGLRSPDSSQSDATEEMGLDSAVDAAGDVEGDGESDLPRESGLLRKELGSTLSRLFGFRPELVGMAGMIIAFIHFLFPRVVLI